MGAGKSAIGRALARRLKFPFHDTDLEVERRAGVDIAYIFEREGEAGFRARERQVVADLCQVPNIVLATGGGTILDADNRHDLNSNGVVVYLKTGVPQQILRTRRRAQRPLLQTADPAARLTELYAVRDPLYRSIAHIIVHTDGRRVPEMVRLIMSTLDADPDRRPH